MNSEQASQAWSTTQAKVKQLRQEQAELSNRIDKTSDMAKLEELFLREQILPSLITAAEVAERVAYADLMDAQVAELKAEFAERQAEIEDLRSQIAPLEDRLQPILTAAQRLDAHIRGLQSDRATARVAAENLQIELRSRAQRQRAPVVRALNVAR